MRRGLFPAIWITLIFLLAGLAFLRKTGMHLDASFELAAFYPCSSPAHRMTLFGSEIPLMVIQYLGALKAWLFQPWLEHVRITPTALRLPTLFLGAASVWMFVALLKRVGGCRAAVAGGLLLATDASFVIATAYDFGPVVLLHFSLIAGMLLLLRYERGGGKKYVALAFFLFGLALWHKALFVWMLVGLAAAGVVTFPRRIRALASVSTILVALVSLGAGALPLIYYNVVTSGATLQTANVMSGEAPLSQKLLLFKRTMDSSAVFGWMTEETQPATAVEPARMGGRMSIAVARAAGRVRSNGMFWAFLIACGLLPWLWFTPARRAALFASIYLAVTWAQMAAVPNAGGSLHHAILLWPFPHFLISVAGSQLSRAVGKHGLKIAVTTLVILTGCNLLVLNQLYADLTTNGTTVIWTDAVYPLFADLSTRNTSRVVVVDWGYADTLCLFSAGQMPLHNISYLLLQPSRAEITWIRSLMMDPWTVFVDHAEGGAQFVEARRRMASIATEAGYKKHILSVIRDRNRRPRFEISRYTK